MYTLSLTKDYTVGNPNLVFLLETQLEDFEIQSVRIKYGFDSFQTMECKWSSKERERDGHNTYLEL